MAKWTTADIPAQNGRLAMVTGGNSGIGWETALELARAGAEVILTSRTEAKGRNAVERIRQQLPQGKVRFEVVDLASLRSVKSLAAKIGNEAKLDLLVNNAGVMSVPKRQLTEDGFEVQFGTNFLGPFALTGLLMPVLQRAATPRVTTVSSGAANMGMKKIDFDDLQGEKRYSPWKAYCQSKLADLLFALELKRRCGAAGIGLLSNAAHPGFARTNLQTSGPARATNIAEKILALLLSQDAVHGAMPTLRAATEASAAASSYYAPDGLFQMNGAPVLIGVPKPAQDETAARRLWETAEKLTGVKWFASSQSRAAMLTSTRI